MLKRLIVKSTILTLLLVILVACGAAGEPAATEPPTTVPPTDTPQPSPVETPELVVGNEAYVETVQVLIMESMPVQVALEITGYLPDGCTSIASVIPERDGNTFNVAITTQRNIAALCTQALVPFSERVSLEVLGLPAGTYTVSVAGRDGTITETFSLDIDNEPVGDEPPVTGSIALPAACFPQEGAAAATGPFINLQDGYCFQYPVEAGFRVHDVLAPGIAAVWGPALTPGFEPIRAGFSVYKKEAAAGRSLDEIVAAVLTENPGAFVADPAAAFAGEPAQVIEGVEGMMDSRQWYLIHDGSVYQITLVPLTQPVEFEEAVKAQRELLWQTVSSTFTWLPAETVAQFAACPPLEPAGPFPKSPYINARDGYCLLYPSHYGQQDSVAQNMLVLTGPALDPTIPEPLRVMVTMAVLGPAEGRTLQQVVDELIAEYPDLEIEQSATTLGGEAAILVSGLPARLEGRDLFVLHNDRVYRLRMEPLGFPELAEDQEMAWELITGSFLFLP
jgi:inhibitor of cysteine peptidase